MTEYEKISIKRKILVVEDNEINREMIKEILKPSYNIVEACDGEEGMKILKEEFRSLSLILLDVRMPKMNGYEFLKEYRENEIISTVPVIVTTGSTISEDEERCLALGASDFVTKPYNPKIMLRRIEAIIRLSESMATLRAVEFDAITGLYTRRAFFHHTENLLSKAPFEEYDMLFMNIEGFSYLNERYGTAKCNELLRHIGKCILKEGEENVVSCRYHADRFALIRKHREADHEKSALEFDCAAHINSPISDYTLKFAVYENIDKKVSPEVLCHRLSLAVESVKHQYNKRIGYYAGEMSEKINRLHRIEESMEEALAQGQFEVYYQPKHSAKTGKISGAEALVRWVHPEYGFMSPADFIPLFEQNGFITRLDLYVWETVCQDMKNWELNGIETFPVSVNASRRDFIALFNDEQIFDPIEKYGIDKNNLHIEITESLGVDDMSLWQKVAKLRKKGIKIELDDFGSGQSSLGALNDIPMDVIKLDISFTRRLLQQKEVVKMIISLAHALGKTTVAEGVETEEQADILKSYGCDQFQGYFYSKPLPESEFREYVKNGNCI